MRYEFHVKGQVGDAVAEEFGQLTVEVAPNVTVFHGAVRDQAELHAVLDHFQTLGLEIIELRQLPAAARANGS
jgi:hypothetical protein